MRSKRIDPLLPFDSPVIPFLEILDILFRYADEPVEHGVRETPGFYELVDLPPAHPEITGNFTDGMILRVH